MLGAGSHGRFQDSLARMRTLLRRAWQGQVPHDVAETPDPPVVGRRVTDEQGAMPGQAQARPGQDALRQ